MYKITQKTSKSLTFYAAAGFFVEKKGAQGFYADYAYGKVCQNTFCRQDKARKQYRHDRVRKKEEKSVQQECGKG